MRRLVFYTAAAVSFLGAIGPILLFLDSVMMCVEGRSCISVVGSLYYLTLCIAAWWLYTMMGFAWITHQKVRPWIPILGCLVGIAAIADGGTFESPRFLILLLPAVIVAGYLTEFLLRVASKIFGPGCPARFRSGLSMQDAKRSLQAALIATSGEKDAVSLVGEVVGDRIRIQCIVRGDGLVKRNYTCFSGRIVKLGEGCELIGSFIVPLHGKLLMAVLLLSTSIFTVADFWGSITSQPGSASSLRGPVILLAAMIAIPHLFGLDRQRITEISARIGQALKIDG